MSGLNQTYNRFELSNLLQNVRGTVIHNDIDGLLSGVYIYQKYNIPIVGIIELGSNEDDIGCLSIDAKFDINSPKFWDEILFLDCGITIDKAKVIDHHSCPAKFYNERKINYVKNFSKTENISDKCPVGNILWLMAIHKEDISLFNELQQMLLLSADGTHMNYFNYPSNTKYALDILNLNNFVPTIEKYGKQRYFLIDNELGMSMDPFFRVERGFKNSLQRDIFDVSKEINRIMNWTGNPIEVNSAKRYNLKTYLECEGGEAFTYTSIRKNEFRITKFI